jgi:hypothetical protein
VVEIGGMEEGGEVAAGGGAALAGGSVAAGIVVWEGVVEGGATVGGVEAEAIVEEAAVEGGEDFAAGVAAGGTAVEESDVEVAGGEETEGVTFSKPFGVDEVGFESVPSGEDAAERGDWESAAGLKREIMVESRELRRCMVRALLSVGLAMPDGSGEAELVRGRRGESGVRDSVGDGAGDVESRVVVGAIGVGVGIGAGVGTGVGAGVSAGVGVGVGAPFRVGSWDFASGRWDCGLCAASVFG